MFDKIRRGPAALCSAAVLSTIGFLPALVTAGCSAGDAGDGSSLGLNGATGSVGLAITSPDGQLISSVRYTVTNKAGEVVHNDVVNVSDPNSTISVTFSLVAATGYTISMTADSVQGGHCAGSATFDVVKGSTTHVALSLACGAAADGNGVVVVNGTLDPSCPRVSTETVAPLVTSVGGVLTLNGAASSSDAVLTWSATSGTIKSPNAATTTFTCTAPGTATVTLTATRGTTCVDSKRVDVSCVTPLPTSLVLTDCQATRVCQLEQQGTDWKAVCDAGATVLSGTVQGSTVAWHALDGSACTATLQNGHLNGTCQSDAGTCPVSSADPLPSATCLTVPSQILSDGCGSADTRCDVVQNGCTWQASCADGKVFGGTATATGLRWTAADRSSCRTAASNGTLPAGTLSGTCTPPSSNKTATACNFTLQRPADLPPDPVCQPLASSFVLDGCGFNTQYADTAGSPICRTTQNGCLWQTSCGDVSMSGRATDSTYTWTTSDGKNCTGTVTAGKLSGSCSDGTNTCAFQQRDPQPPQACQTVPPSLTIDGCGVQGSCVTVQDGCDWQALCNGVVTYDGIATSTGLALLTHIDDAPFWCTLDIAGSAITGSCAPYPVADGGAGAVCSISGAVASSGGG
ncbi:MAG TPA: hypothetical protein VHC69_31755 [Polyangiaceae bacterium]|nr:hypothetical protein [Polyangiaceae bacterium]